MQAVFYFVASFTVLCLLITLCLPLLAGPSQEAERMFKLVRSTREDRRKIRPVARLTDQLLSLSRSLRERLGSKGSTAMQTRLMQAGVRGNRAVDYFFAAQSLAVIGGIVGGSCISASPIFWGFAGAVIGFMAPDMWLTSASNGRRDRIRRSLPDAIDLLVICVNAGLGLDQAILRVSQELGISHPELNAELQRLNLERQAGKPRPEAWADLASRTRVDELKAFAGMLSEADRFGTPIANALVTFSEEMRLRRRHKAEEAAAKTKIKIIFPLVLFIFPSIFIVMLAPAVLSLLAGLGAVGK